jgi:transcription elongation factor GreA
MSTVAHQPEEITREGYERLRAELDQLVTIKRAADPVDDHEALERRIDELEAALAFSRIASPPEDGVAGIGQRVSIRLAKGTAPVDYHLVGAIEADATARRISVDSPIGQALVGRRVGESVEAETPGGTRVIEIVAVGSD